jgi:ubiquinone/menaquinone biosynthesis C-methylase UbiE
MTRSSEQHALVRSQFARQAATFESPAYLFTDESILGWISDHVPVSPGERVLDVAGGTGALARHLAGRGASAVVLDLVPEMLAAAPRRADVLYVLGDAAAMPFADAQFDLVVTRFAVHHLEDPLAVFRQMARVGVDGARVAVIDMLDGGLAHNELERLRDPSHTAALSRETLVALLREAGFTAEIVSEREQAIDGARWLAQAHGDRDAVLAALQEEAAGGAPTGLKARVVADALQITHTWALVSGSKIAG